MNKTGFKRILGAAGAIVGGFYVVKGLRNRTLPSILVGAACGYAGYKMIASATDLHLQEQVDGTWEISGEKK